MGFPERGGPAAAGDWRRRIAQSMAERCQIVVSGLQVWKLGLAVPYDLVTKVVAVGGSGRRECRQRPQAVRLAVGACGRKGVVRRDGRLQW